MSTNRVPSGVPAGGQFTQSAKAEPDVSITDTVPTTPTVSTESASAAEAEAIDALIDDLREKTEWPESEHYDADDLASIEQRIAELTARRDQIEAMNSTDPRRRFTALAAEQDRLRRATAQAAVDAMIATVKEEHPGATHLVLGASDQGDYATFDGVVLGDGSLYEPDYSDADYDIEDAAGWLSFDDQRDDWADRVVAATTPNDDVNVLLRAGNVKVVRIA